MRQHSSAGGEVNWPHNPSLRVSAVGWCFKRVLLVLGSLRTREFTEPSWESSRKTGYHRRQHRLDHPYPTLVPDSEVKYAGGFLLWTDLNSNFPSASP